MDPLSASITVVESCIIVGKEVVKRYNYHKAAESDVAETLLKINVLWEKKEAQIKLLQSIWDTLEGSQQESQLGLLAQLEIKLNAVIKILDTVIGEDTGEPSVKNIMRKAGRVRKGKYAFKAKRSLEHAVAQFVEWQDLLFDPQWYLLSRNRGTDIDVYLHSEKYQSAESPLKHLKDLRKSIAELNEKNNVVWDKEVTSEDFLSDRRQILYSSAAVAEFNDRPGQAVVDTLIAPESAERAEVLKDLKALARALHRMDPATFGLLTCFGVINKSHQGPNGMQWRFDLAFAIPKGYTDPQSLRKLLKIHRPSLNLKLAISRQLATSVFYMHASGFVHKNIRPETILLFESPGSSTKTSFLVGFEKFRLAESKTTYSGDDLLERNLYRHPLRQGQYLDTEYIMQHDVYSLGVCLLEVGLWVSFVEPINEGDVYDNVSNGYIPHEMLNISEFLDDKNPRKRSANIKKRLLMLAEEHLPITMGMKFKEVVVNCLTCLDDTGWNESRNQNSRDVDVGVQFVEEILGNLQDIVV